MANNFYLAPTVNYKQTTLNGSITNSATTITLNSTTNMPTLGYVVIDRQDSAGNNTPGAREVVSYTGISGNDLTGCTRGADNSSALAHNNNALVETMPTVGMWNSLVSAVRSFVDANGYIQAVNSPVSIARAELTQAVIPSIASIGVGMFQTRIDASGASISGFPRTFVWYAPGFASAATTNVMRLIAPFAGTFRAFTMMTRTPVSAASLQVTVFNSGASIFGGVTAPGILGGGTFVSTASILNPNFTPGQTLTMDIVAGGNVADIVLEGISY